MLCLRCFFLLRTALVAMTLPFLAAVATAAESESYRLTNGLEVILKENHSSAMVASIIYLKSGSKYESQFENGITHLLEHLLFDGTTHLSREELDKSITGLGGYINAFTDKEVTGYLVLLPRQFIDYGLTVQADMLFNSIFPEDELTKERKVVIEEIKREADAPGAMAETFFAAMAYRGTPYERPVAGYAPFIETIPRAAIVDYWKRNYIPANMTMLVIGDFVPDSMKASIEGIFGPIPNPAGAAFDTTGGSGLTHRQLLPRAVGVYTPLKGATRYDTAAAVPSTYIDLSIDAPKVGDSDYYAFDLLSRYLGTEEVSPLLQVLTGGGAPLATKADVSLSPHEEFSRLEISVITEKPESRDTIVAAVLSVLKGMSEHSADPKSIEGIKVTNRCEQIYNAERLQYYGFLVAPLLAAGGWDFVQHYSDNFDKATWRDCQKVAADRLKKPKYCVTVVRPATDSGKPLYKPQVLTAERVAAHFDSTTFPTVNLAAGYPLTFPRTDSVRFEFVDRATYQKQVMGNGLTVVVKSSPDSRVFAMCVIGKNRSADEPDSLAGITDFINRCAEKGTFTRSGAELSRDLAAIGANVTLYDNPWIPYDDRYTTRSFSFMKFETIDEFAERGFFLFSEMLLEPAFDSVEVENVRQAMLGVLGREAVSPSNVGLNLFYRTLFENKAYAKGIDGTPATLGAITAADLRDYHARFYAPGNMILTIATSRTVPEVMSWVERRFGRLCQLGPESAPALEPAPVLTTKQAHKELAKEQINIYLGGKLPGASNPEYATIAVATAILSDRLFTTLREKQGLAYSVGAGNHFDRDFGWYYCSMGTGSQNYRQALDGILLQMEKLTLDGPTEAELNQARNGIWGRLMSAKVSRINQAYYLGVDAYLGRGVDADRQLLRDLEAVSPETIRRVCGLYFRTDAYILATAGKKPAEQ